MAEDEKLNVDEDTGEVLDSWKQELS
jgi:hypothetical protein